MDDIESWKLKKLIKSLDKAVGSGTSVISIIVPANCAINLIRQMLTTEYGTASNIKSRVNRLSVLGAITSAQTILKKYNKTPLNGLVVFCGEIMTENGKTKKLTIDFEPPKPINNKLYLCDNRFHTEDLHILLESSDNYGYIIMNGNGTLYATLQGNVYNIINQFNVELPKKHGRGGQSALRFSRLRLEARHNYLRKVAEHAEKIFISDNQVNVKGIVVGGSAEFKTELTQSSLFDNRLKKSIIKIVDISYGGENGLKQAIELSKDALGDLKFVKEKKILEEYFDEIAMDSGKYCFGSKEVMYALESGAVEKLIVWEDIDLKYYKLKNKDEEKELYLRKDQEKNSNLFVDCNGCSYDIIETEEFVEWIVEHYKEYGTELELVSDKTPEGNQFSKGFGGLGAILRWKLDFDIVECDNDLYDSDDEDDFI